MCHSEASEAIRPLVALSPVVGSPYSYEISSLKLRRSGLADQDDRRTYF